MAGIRCPESSVAVPRVLWVTSFSQYGPSGILYVFRRVIHVFEDKTDFTLIPCTRVIRITRIGRANVTAGSITRSPHNISVVGMYVVKIVILPTEAPALVQDSATL